MNDMSELELALAASAPRPGAQFETELETRLRVAYAARHTLTASQSKPRFRMTWRAAAVLIIVAVLGVGGVLAVSAIMQTWIQGDQGLSEAWRSETDIELNQSITQDGLTLTAEWANADWNRLAIGFTLGGLVCPERYDAGCYVAVTAQKEDGTPLEMLIGRADESDLNHRIYLYDYSMAGLDSSQAVANVRLQAVPRGGWVTGPHPENPSVEAWEHEPLSDPLVLNLSIPLSHDVRLITDPIIASDQGIAMTLRRVVVTPTQTRMAVCFAPPSADRTWTAIPGLTADGAVVAGGGADLDVSGVGESNGETCREFPFNAAMYDYDGPWRLMISELVGFGPGGGADQQRIAGSWVFEFQTTP
ncbi:MAG: DUF4179 domain-containing protein [Anaerolineae bacterium]|nr:DUF4179 domain-containing protein [Anaerolineae bacterium]